MKIKKECIICGDKIYRSSVRGGLKERRQSFAITCSKKCARVYWRVRHRVADSYIGEINTLKRRIKKLENEKEKR